MRYLCPAEEGWSVAQGRGRAALRVRGTDENLKDLNPPALYLPEKSETNTKTF